MRMIKVSQATLQLIRAKRPAGFSFGCAATELEDGRWSVPVDDEVAAGLVMERVRGEADTASSRASSSVEVREAAREIGTDHSNDTFNRALAKVVARHADRDDRAAEREAEGEEKSRGRPYAGKGTRPKKAKPTRDHRKS